jgi:transketolase
VEYKGPVYIRLGRPAVPVLHAEGYRLTIGKAETLRDGKDVAVIATGIMVSMALEAAETLAGESISVRVINMHTIKPVDVAAIVAAAKETGAIVTAEEHNIIGGLGSAVAEVVGENHPVPIERVGVKDTFGESGQPDELLVKYGLTAGAIAAAVKKAIGRK